MNRYAFKIFLVLFTVIFCTNCVKTNNEVVHCPCFERKVLAGEENFVGIENISFENYPRVDGSTSANVLNWMVACKQLGVSYEWRMGIYEWVVGPYWPDIPEQYSNSTLGNRVMTSQTHGAFMNLIDGKADIILTHRTISPDEKLHADAVGVSLIETPIALDAFVFVVQKNNPIQSLTIDQIQKIYTNEISNWAQVGGNNAEIQALSRPRNSGSEEVFRTLVMNGIEPADFPEAQVISLMIVVLKEVLDNDKTISYTFNAYKDLQARRPCNEVPVIAINGICPSEITVKNRTYPFISEVHVAIRADLDHNSMAYKLYEWLQSEHAKYTLTECGFIPK